VTRAGATLHYPLFGLRVEAPPAVIGPLAIEAIDWSEWAYLEKTDVVRGEAHQYLAAERLGQDVAVGAPPCLRIPVPDELDAGGPFALGDWLVLFTITGLRILGCTRFAEPRFTSSARTSADPYAPILRRPGVYRQAFYDLLAMDLDVLPAGAVSEVTDLSGRAQALVERQGDLELRLIAQFLAAYAPAIGAVGRATIQFSLLEALFGRGPMEERVAVATGDPSAAAWLAGHGQRVRNAVAHGDARAAGLAEEAIGPLDAIVRAAMRAYLMFAVDRDASNPRRAFNAQLAGAAG
jgi:hypothetical protein